MSSLRRIRTAGYVVIWAQLSQSPTHLVVRVLFRSLDWPG